MWALFYPTMIFSSFIIWHHPGLSRLHTMQVAWFNLMGEFQSHEILLYFSSGILSCIVYPSSSYILWVVCAVRQLLFVSLIMTDWIFFNKPYGLEKVVMVKSWKPCMGWEVMMVLIWKLCGLKGHLDIKMEISKVKKIMIVWTWKQ